MDEGVIYDNIVIDTIPASTGSSQYINRRSSKTPQEPITSGMPEQKSSWLRCFTVTVGLLCISLMLLTGLCVKYTFEKDQLKGKQDQLKSERDKLKTERDQLETEKDQLKTERDQLKSKLSNVTQERDQLLSKVPCPSEWNSFCKCYQIFSPVRSWYKARETCQAMGADLVNIESEEEQVFINGLMGWGWIGLQKRGANWEWVNGRALSTGPVFWEPGQPNADNENCVMLSSNSENPTSNWHDYPCNTNFNIICEKSAN